MSDQGLAAERTALAWGRTALGLVGVAALLLRFAGRESVPALGEVVGAGALLVAGLVWWHGRRDYRAALPLRGAGPLRGLALAVATIAAGAAVAVAIGLA